ncbi:immunity 49 family protein [Streptomyces sp. NPDC015131]|uniref:immunity 49 family protein n=1 Tax=Streptomyces sp. NPDC015131 TaxID=3364941 RepID=UPI003701092E
MSQQVTRHGIPSGPEAEALAQRLADHLTVQIDELEVSTDLIEATFNTSLLVLNARCVLDPRAAQAETWDAVVNAMQLGSAVFAVTGIEEGTVECRIDRKVRTLPASGPSTMADAGLWLQAFWLAVVCREQQRMTELCEIPLERLRSSDGRYDEYVYHWVDTLQTYWLRRPGLVEKLTTTIQTSDPSVATTIPRDMLQGLMYPPINLFYHFVRKNEEGFGPALVEALKLHRAYWTLTEDRATDIDGTVALGPLAIACLAYDGKLPFDVESEYLPKHLLEHGWLGEYPT